MTLEVPLFLQPREAIPVGDWPAGKGWLFEPKYDGFRCILFRDGDTVNLESLRQRPFGRYFPENIDAARRLPINWFVFDGKLITAFGDQRVAHDAFLAKIPPQIALEPILGRIAVEEFGTDCDAAFPARFIEREDGKIQHAAFLQLPAHDIEHGLDNFLMIVIRHAGCCLPLSAMPAAQMNGQAGSTGPSLCLT
jgi:hypothetical protein